MAPIKDETVDALKDLVNKLETRVKQLEDKIQHGGSGAAPTASESVRMILMGPPGAGICPAFSPDFWVVNTTWHRAINSLQVKERKPPRLRRCSHAVTW